MKTAWFRNTTDRRPGASCRPVGKQENDCWGLCIFAQSQRILSLPVARSSPHRTPYEEWENCTETEILRKLCLCFSRRELSLKILPWPTTQLQDRGAIAVGLLTKGLHCGTLRCQLQCLQLLLLPFHRNQLLRRWSCDLRLLLPWRACQLLLDFCFWRHPHNWLLLP